MRSVSAKGRQTPAKGQESKTRGESVYKVIELVGTSTESWERAATVAVDRAGKSLRDLRIAEVVQLDMQVVDGKVQAYRAKVKVSFKFES
jgi:flavin-binding protein dodecin